MAVSPWKRVPVEFIKEVEDDLNDMKKEISMDVLSDVVNGSPVDTGRFRGNHNVSVGKPSGRYRSRTFDDTALGVLTVGAQRIARATVYRDIHIQNLTPYGEVLEMKGGKYKPPGNYAIAFSNASRKI